MRYTNAECREQARRKNYFKNNNDTIYGEWTGNSKDGEVYTVFSYGSHFPMFIWTADRWFENEDGYSATTARHKNQVRPCHDTTLLSTSVMQKLQQFGYREVVRRRLLGAKV